MNQNDVWEQTRPTVKANMNISSYLQNSVQWLQQPHKHDQEADGSVNELEMVERHGEHSTGEPATRHEQARDLSGGGGHSNQAAGRHWWGGEEGEGEGEEGRGGERDGRGKGRWRNGKNVEPYRLIVLD